ncbi:hypothetical protein MASR1M12_18890 [Erysipelotrichia bacterium]
MDAENNENELDDLELNDTDELEDEIELDDDQGEQDSDADLDDDSEDDDSEDEDAEEDDDDEEEEDEESGDDSETGDEKAGEDGKSDKTDTDAKAGEGQEEKKPAYATLDEEIKNRIKPDYIPGTKEFFNAAESEAKKAVEAEFGEYDEFDTKHIARFNYFVNESINSRKAEYQKGIQIITSERKSRETYQEIHNQVDKLLPSPDQKKRLGEALHKISHAAYLEIEKSLAKGDPSKLLELAQKVAGPHGKLLDDVKPPKKQPTKKKGEVFGSDILGF